MKKNFKTTLAAIAVSVIMSVAFAGCILPNNKSAEPTLQDSVVNDTVVCDTIPTDTIPADTL